MGLVLINALRYITITPRLKANPIFIHYVWRSIISTELQIHQAVSIMIHHNIWWYQYRLVILHRILVILIETISQFWLIVGLRPELGGRLILLESVRASLCFGRPMWLIRFDFDSQLQRYWSEYTRRVGCLSSGLCTCNAPNCSKIWSVHSVAILLWYAESDVTFCEFPVLLKC